MDSSFEGAALDSVECNKLTMEGRQEIVHELAKWSNGASEILLSWSRQDLLQILCVEMGKERKYTGLTKPELIERLLKIVSDKNSSDDHESVVCERPPLAQQSSKRPRKPEISSCLPVSASTTNISSCVTDNGSGSVKYCKNAACKARLNDDDVFCKRCTCCICHKYDDNKDPSLWLTCNSEPPFAGDCCNISCHLECAIKHRRAGIAAKLDGSFYCISCGKMNDLMRCWKKQLIVAKDTRKVDILCYRMALSQKLLSGTRKYRKLSEMVDDAVILLEAEVGMLSDGPVKMGRGIVNRLSCGQQVQRLCASAVNSFDLISHDPSQKGNDIIPVVLADPKTATNSSSLSNPSSVEDETNNIAICRDLNENKTEDYFNYYKIDKKTVDLNSCNERNPSCGSDEEHSAGKSGSEEDQSDVMKIVTSEEISTDNGSNDGEKPGLLLVPSPEATLPITPSKQEIVKDGPSKKRGRKPLNKSKEDARDVKCVRDAPGDGSLEYYVKVIRWLECKGHIEKSFRQNFLTWYSIRATPQESRIVKVFVDTLIEDPIALSEQLVDTFGEIVLTKRSSDVPHGFCLKLWH